MFIFEEYGAFNKFIHQPGDMSEIADGMANNVDPDLVYIVCSDLLIGIFWINLVALFFLIKKCW